ncbi:heavy-metal-associated domain-containing protein [Amycolatopsis echigonensis]|uniref:Cation transporter n=1 Tax=Amycolatopsis echigonensis TaxID=2576905 RepID=A0A8E1W4E0_9PSEU|nr:heavy-metal-associated domain-containing protein [Amycolatopsis echigonensis]MBB2504023.1 cation transporter [Amycolatopsis echigonensis]
MSEIVTVRVEGMHCGACEQRLRTVLGRLDGVGHVEADHTTGVVRLRFDPAHTTPDALATAARDRIEQAGFTVTGDAQREEAGQS